MNYNYPKQANDFLDFKGEEVYFCSQSQHAGSSLSFNGEIPLTIELTTGCSKNSQLLIKSDRNSSSDLRTVSLDVIRRPIFLYPADIKTNDFASPNNEDVKHSRMYRIFKKRGDFCSLLICVLRMVYLLHGDTSMFVARIYYRGTCKAFRTSQDYATDRYTLVRVKRRPLVRQTAERMANGKSVSNGCVLFQTRCRLFTWRSI